MTGLQKILLAIICLAAPLAVSAQSLCTVNGTLYRPTGAVCGACQIKVIRARRQGVVLSTNPQTYTANSAGVISFSAVQGSLTTLQGEVTIGSYNLTSGIEFYIPVQSSASLASLKSVPDQLEEIITPVNYAPNDPAFIVQTPHNGISGEQALSALPTGILKSTTGTGVVSTASSGTDYELPLTFSAPLSRASNTISLPASVLAMQGYIAATRTSTSATINVLSTDSTIFADASSNPQTVNLITAVGVTGRLLFIKKVDTSANAVTIDGLTTETIDGFPTKVLTIANEGVTLQSDGTNWKIIGVF